MEEGGKSGLFVMGETPSDKGDADAVIENGMKFLELVDVDTGVILATTHTDAI